MLYIENLSGYVEEADQPTLEVSVIGGEIRVSDGYELLAVHTDRPAISQKTLDALIATYYDINDDYWSKWTLVASDGDGRVSIGDGHAYSVPWNAEREQWDWRNEDAFIPFSRFDVVEIFEPGHVVPLDTWGYMAMNAGRYALIELESDGDGCPQWALIRENN